MIKKEVIQVDGPAVYIQREPVLTMIWSAIETGRRECLGVLFGRLPSGKRKDFLVDNANALQLVNSRLNTKVFQNEPASVRIEQLRAERPYAYSKIGYFHSHPQWAKTLPTKTDSEISDGDVATMIELETKLEIIVTVSALKSSPVPWEMRSDGSLSGSLVGKNIGLHAYRLVTEADAKVPQKLRIVAPGALRALNRTSKP